MNKKSIQKGLWALLFVAWTAGVFWTVSLGVKELVKLWASEEVNTYLGTTVGATLYSLVLYGVIALVVVSPLLLSNRSLASLKKRLALRGGDWGKMFVWALLAWGLSMAVAFFVTLILYMINIPGLDLTQKQTVGFYDVRGLFEYALVFFVLVVLAPVVEELIFRGYLYTRLQEYVGFAASTLLTSATFAGLHLQPNVIINVFILSLFICWLREKFDSIWPGVIVHALKNGIAYVVIFLLPLYGIRLM